MCWSSKLRCIYPARSRKLLLCEVQQLIFILRDSLWFVTPRFVIKLDGIWTRNWLLNFYGLV